MTAISACYGDNERASMGADVEQWCRWVDYRKHASAPGLTREQVIASTRNGRSARYFSATDIGATETTAARIGTCTRTKKPVTAFKVHEFEGAVGASDGEESRWVLVESTNGDFHGRPITKRVYLERLKLRMDCP